MKIRSILLSAALLPLAALPSIASAQSYPTKPVRIIVPFAPGGATDIVTRLLAQKLNETWGQTVVVDNRGGAGGNIGGELAARSTPDGYTLFMTSGSIVTANPYIYRKMSFDPAKDLVPVSMVSSGPQLIVVNPNFPAKTVKDFIALAKSKPGTISLGSAGIGTQTHLAAENFAHAAGIDIVHVPYKGEGPAITDLMGGQIGFVTPNIPAALGFVQQGRLRALGVTSKQRFPALPDVPAVAESLPGFENIGWFGLMFPAGTPKAIIDRVHADTVKALADPEMKKRFEAQGQAPVGNSPAEFAKIIRDETVFWGRIVRERKIAVQ